MTRDIPNGWRVEKVKNIINIRKGQKVDIYEEYEDGLFNYIDISVLRSKQYKYTNNNKIMATDKDILIVWDGANSGFSSFGLSGAVGSTLAKLTLTDNHILHTYFGKFIFSKFKYLSDTSYGATIPHLQRQMLENINVPIPPLPQQEKIVKVLDISFALIEEQKELIEKYDLFLKSKFAEMFGNPIKNIHNWDIVNLGDIVKLDAPMVEPSNLKYQDMFHIGPNSIEKHTGKLLPALTVKEESLISKKFLFDESYVLYSKIRPNLNKVAVANFKGLCSADMYPIKAIKGKLEKLYLWRLLLSEFFLRYTESLPGRANIPKLNRKELAKFSFPLPPIELQYKFALIVEKIETIKEQENQKLEHLETLHKGLMDKAFKGEIE